MDLLALNTASIVPLAMSDDSDTSHVPRKREYIEQRALSQ